MSMVINTNTASLVAQAAQANTNKAMDTAMERLSTGQRINSAADDAAGLAISTRMGANISGMNQAIRNALDAQSLIDTAEGAQTETMNLMQRMRELAVQGASDTNGTADRTNIRTELEALRSEIDAISTQTRWAGQTLINAATTFTFQVGDRGSETLTVATTAVTADGLSVSDVSGLTTASAFSSFIDTVNTAVATIATNRAGYGANSNRLDHTMSHLATNSEAVKASLGRIQDTDYAAETTNLAKDQILQQAATSMLAQANASKQTILSLIQG